MKTAGLALLAELRDTRLGVDRLLGALVFRKIYIGWILGGLFVLSSCVAAPPVPEDHFYRLQAVNASEPFTRAVFPGTIEVDRFVADGLTSERGIVFSEISQPNQVKAYHYHFWIKPPTIMLRDELVTFLRASKISDAVVTPEMRVHADFALTGKIKHLEQIRAKKKTRILLEVEIGLRRPDNGKLLFLDSYRVETVAGNESVNAAVESLDEALSIVYTEFLTDISKR